MKLRIAKSKNFLRSLVKRDIISVLKFVVGIAVILLFFVGCYYIFLGIFRYLKDIQDIGPLIADKIISLGFLAFFFMLMISNAIGSITTLFRSNETHLLLTLPLNYADVFTTRFTDNLLYSSWATLIVGIPLVLSYSKVYAINSIYIPFIFAFGLMPFLVIPAYIGSAITILLFLTTAKVGFKRALFLFTSLGTVAVLYLFKTGGATTIMMNIQGDIRLLNYYLQNLATAENTILPNVWILELMRSAKVGSVKDFAFWASLMCSTALAFSVIFREFARFTYFPAYLSAVENLGQRKKYIRSNIQKNFLWEFFSPLPADMRAIIVKDFKLFVRDAGQWSQFLVLLVLLLLYLFNLRLVPLNIRDQFWKTVLSFSNFAFCGYILATLAVRFVFPSISMEGRSLWSIFTTPMPTQNLFWAKFISAFIIFALLAEIVAVISNGMLAQSGFMMLLTGAGIFLMSLSLTALSVGLGALFPSFDETNPARIASGGGGMIAALLSLAYVALMVIVLALPTYRYSLYLIGRTHYPKTEIISAFLVVILLNVVTSYLPMKLGINAMKKRDF